MRQQRGYALVAALVFLLVLAAIVGLRSGENAMQPFIAAADAESQRADYVTQAGMQHALWRAQHNRCLGDFTIPATPLAGGSYSAAASGGGSSTTYLAPADQDATIDSANPTSNDGGGAGLRIRSQSGAFEQALLRFDLSAVPAGSRVASAVLRLHVETGKPHPEGPLSLHRVTADWNESVVSWNSFADSYESAALGWIPAQASGDVDVEINLSGQVQAWLNGQPNYGLLLMAASDGTNTEYSSREGPASYRPVLEITIGTAGETLALQAAGTLDSGLGRNLQRPTAIALQASSGFEIRSGEGNGKDAWLREDLWGNNLGANETLRVEDSAGSNDHALLYFDLAGLPRHARVLSARLSLYQYSSGTAGGDIAIHRLRRDWDEGTEINAPGDGATWITYDWWQFWSSPGGDFDPAPAAVATVPSGVQDWQDWDLTALVDGWIQGRYPNQGLVLVPADAGVNAEFYSSDHADPQLHPRLVVDYACACGTSCQAPSGSGQLLMVVVNPTTLVAQDVAKQALFESWGYSVSIVGESDNQSTYDAALANADAVFISETVNASQVGSRLQGTTVGVVSQDGQYNSALGFGAGAAWSTAATINVSDSGHYITAPFATGQLSVYDAAMEQLVISGAGAPELRVLADAGGAPTLAVLEAGALGSGGSTVAGRRVLLPLGRDAQLDWNHINNEGLLLVQRSIAWAMGADRSSLGELLMVVVDPANLTTQEAAKKALMESWGYTVNLIEVDDSQANFDAAVAVNDLAFISEDINSGALGTKLRNAPIGVVTEEDNLSDEFGIADGIGWGSGTTINVDDNAHYITQPFATGSLAVLNTTESLAYLTPSLSPDLAALGSTGGGPSLAALETGSLLSDGGNATGRRVLLPWGGNAMDINYLTADGLEIFQRALAWAAGAELRGPVAHWRLDETGGTLAVDSAGGHDGTLSNGPSWTFGQIGGGLAFDGSNDRVLVADDSTLDISGPMTMMAWVRPEQVGRQYLLRKAQHDAIDGYELSLSSGGKAFFRVNQASSGDSYRIDSTSSYPTDGSTWIHIAASYDGSTMRLYVNGVEEASLAGPAAIGTNDLQLSIGGQVADPMRVLLGTLDDVRLYDRALSSGEIAVLAQAPPKLLLVVGDPAALTTADSDRAAQIGAWGYGITLIDDGASQASFNAAVSGHDVVFVTGSINGGSLADKLTNANRGIVNEFPGKLDNFGFSSSTGATITAASFTTTDGAHYIAEPFAGNPVTVFTGNQLLPVPSGTLAPDLQPAGEISGTPALVTLDSGAVTWNGGSAPGRRVHLPYADITLDQVTADGLTLMHRAIDWAAGAGADAGGGGTCAATIADDFQTDDYSGNTGDLPWNGNWFEVNEGNGPSAGDEQVVAQGAGNFVARVRDNDGGFEGILRSADLSAYTSATLAFDYWRGGLDNANDFVSVEIWPDAGGQWQEVLRIAGPGSDSSSSPPNSTSVDISAFITNDTHIRFITSPTMGNTDAVYLDNVQIQLSGCAN